MGYRSLFVLIFFVQAPVNFSSTLGTVFFTEVVYGQRGLAVGAQTRLHLLICFIGHNSTYA